MVHKLKKAFNGTNQLENMSESLVFKAQQELDFIEIVQECV